MICDVIYLNILMWKYNLITNNNNQKLKKYQNSWRCSPHCCPFGQYFPKGWYCPYKFPVGNRSMFELSQHIPTFGQYFPKGWYCPYKFPAGNRSMFELYQHIPTFFLSALSFLLFPTILIPPPPQFPSNQYLLCVIFKLFKATSFTLAINKHFRLLKTQGKCWSLILEMMINWFAVQ